MVKINSCVLMSYTEALLIYFSNIFIKFDLLRVKWKIVFMLKLQVHYREIQSFHTKYINKWETVNTKLIKSLPVCINMCTCVTRNIRWIVFKDLRNKHPVFIINTPFCKKSISIGLTKYLSNIVVKVIIKWIK